MAIRVVQKGANENAQFGILQFACGLYKVMFFFGIAFSSSETTQSNGYSAREARFGGSQINIGSSQANGILSDCFTFCKKY